MKTTNKCHISPQEKSESQEMWKRDLWGQEKTTPQAKKLNLSQIHMDQSKI